MSWIASRSDQPAATSPLFICLDPANKGKGLTGNGIYTTVRSYFEQVTDKQMSPHRIRHSAITTALDLSGGNVREVQKLSRHKKLDTLLIYDDARLDVQGKTSQMLSDSLD